MLILIMLVVMGYFHREVSVEGIAYQSDCLSFFRKVVKRSKSKANMYDIPHDWPVEAVLCMNGLVTWEI